MSWQTSNTPEWWETPLAANWDDTTSAWDSTDYNWDATDGTWKTATSVDWYTEN